jgi:hypothetical protein
MRIILKIGKAFLDGSLDREAAGSAIASASSQRWSLLTIFAEKMAGSSRAEMDSVQHFLDGEIAFYRDQLRPAEKRRSDLAEKYSDIVRNRSPDAPGGDDERQSARTARATVDQLKLEMADTTSKRDAIQKELASVLLMLTVDHGGPQVIVTGGHLSPVEERLQELRRNLDGSLFRSSARCAFTRAAAPSRACCLASGSGAAHPLWRRHLIQTTARALAFGNKMLDP